MESDKNKPKRIYSIKPMFGRKVKKEFDININGKGFILTIISIMVVVTLIMYLTAEKQEQYFYVCDNSTKELIEFNKTVYCNTDVLFLDSTLLSREALTVIYGNNIPERFYNVK